ncbi:UNVERIFIED_CONTAM: hypothetical protein PYX00_007148 [Menopon gallinae]|uniref:Uncharacterized protein n=1 Tax=Menopon gallinae TaxID=328185 RepID=A0AAW2HIP6_9NEOP
MAAAHKENFSPELRVVVDYVDEDRLHPVADNGRLQKSKTEGDESSQNWENPTARIKRIQVEAECRKMEFARLLEEHAQVIRTLKQIEEKEMPHIIPNSVANVTKA